MWVKKIEILLLNSVSTLNSRCLYYLTILLFSSVNGEMTNADLNFCTHTCLCILNMFPKPFCGFVVILVFEPDEVPVSGL